MKKCPQLQNKRLRLLLLKNKNHGKKNSKKLLLISRFCSLQTSLLPTKRKRKAQTMKQSTKISCKSQAQLPCFGTASKSTLKLSTTKLLPLRPILVNIISIALLLSSSLRSTGFNMRLSLSPLTMPRYAEGLSRQFSRKVKRRMTFSS